MATDHRTYLAGELLSEARIVTYRSLSRAQNVHVNTAKEILYEFHQRQNAKKPGSIHATYLVSGVRKPALPNTAEISTRMDEDSGGFPSSSFPVSSMPDASNGGTVTTSIILAREEDLERARETFETTRAIHIYSLEPHSLKDLQVLSNTNREVFKQYTDQDPLDNGSRYGTIINPNVKRRNTRNVPRAAAAPVPNLSSTSTGKKALTETGDTKAASRHGSNPTEKPEDKEDQVVIQPREVKKKEMASQAPKSKRESSSLFKAFAKAKPKITREDTDSSVALSAEPSIPEDEPMKDASEEEQEEDFSLPSTTNPPKDKEAERESRARRQERLRKVMEEDDDDGGGGGRDGGDDDDGDDDDGDDDDDKPSAAEPPKNDRRESTDDQLPQQQTEPSRAMSIDEPVAVPVIAPAGRRRGRRKVMKKKTVKDEEGYLVTKEEPTWESFSEDEPDEAVVKKKMKVNVPASSSSSTATTAATLSSTVLGSAGGGPVSGKSKKAGSGAHKTRGNIASFFSKK